MCGGSSLAQRRRRSRGAPSFSLRRFSVHTEPLHQIPPSRAPAVMAERARVSSEMQLVGCGCVSTFHNRSRTLLFAAVMAERARLSSEMQHMARTAMKDHDTQDQKLRRLLNYAVVLEKEVNSRLPATHAESVVLPCCHQRLVLGAGCWVQQEGRHVGAPGWGMQRLASPSVSACAAGPGA